jgi:hypothetical protein
VIESQRARQAREAQPLRAAAQTRTSIPAVMCVSRRHGPLGFGPGRAGRDGRKRGTRVLTAGGAGGWEARRAYTADAARHHADAEERARARAELRLQRERAQQRHLRRPSTEGPPPRGRRDTAVGCGRGASRAPRPSSADGRRGADDVGRAGARSCGGGVGGGLLVAAPSAPRARPRSAPGLHTGRALLAHSMKIGAAVTTYSTHRAPGPVRERHRPDR